MVMQAVCICGKVVTIDDQMYGQEIHCMRCGRPIQMAPERPPPPPDEAAAPGQPEVGDEPQPVVGSLRDSVYWIIALSLIPLAYYLARPPAEGDFERQLHRTMDKLAPAEKQAAEATWQQVKRGRASFDDLFTILPGNRLEGAWLPRRSHAYIMFALAASFVCWLVVLASFTSGSVRRSTLHLVGLFTGTFGITLLLFLLGCTPVGLVVQTIMMQDHAQKPDIFLTWAVYTFGVGLFEESIKLVPLLWYLKKNRRITWRVAVLWGLASGAGFGISEGLMYSANFYNGIAPANIYLVRFVSCVALHAIWTASAGMSLFHSQGVLRAAQHWEEIDDQAALGFSPERPLYTIVSGRKTDWGSWVMILIRCVIVVMFLHGLYDAALTRQMYPVAFATAVVSFCWLAWQVERARAAEIRKAKQALEASV